MTISTAHLIVGELGYGSVCAALGWIGRALLCREAEADLARLQADIDEAVREIRNQGMPGYGKDRD